jgi:hypothetical protein
LLRFFTVHGRATKEQVERVFTEIKRHCQFPAGFSTRLCAVVDLALSLTLVFVLFLFLFVDALPLRYRLSSRFDDFATRRGVG